jgi:hypothetical protein
MTWYHIFMYFLPSDFLSCKKTFINNYDKILNYNGLKYGTYEILEKN